MRPEPGADLLPEGGPNALAWLLAQGGDIVPIPGTRRSERVEENVGADAIELSAGQLNRLNDVEPPVGDRYADMTPVNR
jgi:aryl-alcohol dehydrogenase-like predicted oxidoreductase